MNDRTKFDSASFIFGGKSVTAQTHQANSAFHPFGVDKLSSAQLYRMCADRDIW